MYAVIHKKDENYAKRVKILREIKVNGVVAFVEVLVPDSSKKVIYAMKHIMIHGEPYTREIKLYSQHTNILLSELDSWVKGKGYSDFTGLEQLFWDIAQYEKVLWVDIRQREYVYIFYTARYKFAPEAEFETVTQITVLLLPCNNMCDNISITITDVMAVPPGVISIGHQDIWIRSMLWTAFIVHQVGDGPDPTAPIRLRIKWANFVHSRMGVAQKRVIDAIAKTSWTPEERQLFAPFPPITVIINAWSLPVGKVGMYSRFSAEKSCHLTIHEAVFNQIMKNKQLRRPGESLPYYEYILLHEMIHAAFSQSCYDSDHGPAFMRIAEALELPEKYSK